MGRCFPSSCAISSALKPAAKKDAPRDPLEVPTNLSMSNLKSSTAAITPAWRAKARNPLDNMRSRGFEDFTPVILDLNDGSTAADVATLNKQTTINDVIAILPAKRRQPIVAPAMLCTPHLTILPFMLMYPMELICLLLAASIIASLFLVLSGSIKLRL
jgi:hypothetical protein